MVLPRKALSADRHTAHCGLLPGAGRQVHRRRDQGCSRRTQLPLLTERLDEHAHWTQVLSGGEQQRISVVRALLAKPEWLLMDEFHFASWISRWRLRIFTASVHSCQRPRSCRSATARLWRSSITQGSTWCCKKRALQAGCGLDSRSLPRSLTPARRDGPRARRRSPAGTA